jgi:signal-transduction protein with cAMP-binding, CBS, and nucleotidyltransferase domain
VICPTCGYDNLPGNETCSYCEQALTLLDLPTPHSQVERSLMEDPVSTLHPRPPITVAVAAPVREAVRFLLDRNIGALLVVNDHGRLVGIFSERDLLKKIAGIHENFGELTVGDFMTPNPETVAPSDPLNFALHRMDIGGYRHMPVVEAGLPIGMISVRDMLRHITTLCQER